MLNTLYSKTKGKNIDEPIILLHGLFGSSDNLGRVAASLSNSYWTHSLDLRNHGRSFHHDLMSYRDMAEDIKQYIDENNLDKVNILGHSMGGKVAMELALTYPERIDKMIVADISPVSYPPHHSDIIKGLKELESADLSSREFADQILSQHVQELGVRQFLLKNLSFDKSRKLQLKLNLAAIEKNYSNIMLGQSLTTNQTPFQGPVLFIAGGDSNYIKAEHKDHILALFPHAKLRTIPGTGHWLHAEKTNLFNGICERFLRK